MSCEDLKPVTHRWVQRDRLRKSGWHTGGEAGDRRERPETCKPETSLPSAMQPVRRTVDGGHR